MEPRAGVSLPWRQEKAVTAKKPAAELHKPHTVRGVITVIIVAITVIKLQGK